MTPFVWAGLCSVFIITAYLLGYQNGRSAELLFQVQRKKGINERKKEASRARIKAKRALSGAQETHHV